MNGHAKLAIIGILISTGLAFGINPLLPFWNIFAISAVGFLGIWSWNNITKIQTDDMESALIESDEAIQKFEGDIVEMDEVIREYERIFDTQSVEMPCPCGGTMFEGLFQPGVDNVVQCPSCKETYNVLVSFDSILKSIPSDDNILDKIERDTEV